MVSDVVSGSTETATDRDVIDYGSVDVPDIEPSEYHYTHRRARLLQLVEEAGHPDALNQTELADRFGVSQQQISKDLDRLATFVRDRLESRDQRAFTVDSVLQRCIREMLDDGEWRQAAKTALEYEEWAAGFSDLEELHERVAHLEEMSDTGSFTH
jgi:polyhydroxyalkanoate synthesis regulator phasin